MNELPIMPIRAKYADELSEGSVDKKAIATLQESLANLDSKSAKVYVGSGDITGLTDAQVREIIDGKYYFVRFEDITYIVSFYNNEIIDFTFVGIESLTIITTRYLFDVDAYVYDGEISANLLPLSSNFDSGKVLTADATGKPIWKAPAELGTKLYRHDVKLTGAGAPYLVHFITTSNDLITKGSSGNDVYFILKADTLINFYGDRSANVLAGILFPISAPPGSNYYTLYTLDTTTGTFVILDLSPWTISDTVTPL